MRMARDKRDQRLGDHLQHVRVGAGMACRGHRWTGHTRRHCVGRDPRSRGRLRAAGPLPTPGAISGGEDHPPDERGHPVRTLVLPLGRGAAERSYAASHPMDVGNGTFAKKRNMPSKLLEELVQ